MISILVNGAAGRMGQVAVHAISEHANFKLVGKTMRGDDLRQAIQHTQAQVVVDFTHPSVVFANTSTIIKAGARPVIGTTGLHPEQIAMLMAACQKAGLGGVIAPNFSLGTVLMMKQAVNVVKYLPQVEIIEMHHDGKADSPSGTAIRLAEMLVAANPQLNQPEKPSRATLPHARGAMAAGVPIHAVRLPGLLASLQVIFGSAGETVTFSENTIDRQCFMPGLLLACEKVMVLDKLVYGLDELI